MRIQAWHIVVLIVAFVLLFGWKNLPNVARSMGESMRVFKSEVDQMKDEGDTRRAEKERPALDDRGATPAGGTAGDRDRRDLDDRHGGYREGDYHAADRHDRYEDTAQRDYREQADRRPDDPRV